MGEYINGIKIAKDHEEHITEKIKNLVSETSKRQPHLEIIQVGENPASNIYIKRKKEVAERMGVEVYHTHLAEDISEDELIRLIQIYNGADHTDGIIVQMPIPEHISQSSVINAINPDKDVDGFHPLNMGKLATRNPGLRPCTPHGVIMMLDSIEEMYKGRHATVIGASNHVGRAMVLELLLAGATVSVAHKFTPPEQLKELTLQSDIVISAVGKPNFITKEHIKKDATVIDVGITRSEGGKIVGDVEKDVIDVAKYVSPVPGGVGPMTVMMLFKNCLQAYIDAGLK